MDERHDRDYVSFVTARGPSLTRLAFVLTGGDEHLAHDLVQDTLLKTYRRWGRVCAADAVDAYVRRMLVNEYLSWRRRASKRELSMAAVPDEPAVGPVPEEAAGQADIWSSIRRMPARQRAVLVLRYYEDLTDQEIADVLNYRVGSVRVIARRALDELGRRMNHAAPRRR